MNVCWDDNCLRIRSSHQTETLGPVFIVWWFFPLNFSLSVSDCNWPDKDEEYKSRDLSNLLSRAIMIILLSLLSLTTVQTTAQTFDLSLNNTWRCGVFIPEPGVKNSEPLLKYFVLQNYVLTSCPASFRDRYKKGTFAKGWFQKIKKKNNAIWHSRLESLQVKASPLSLEFRV